MDPVIIGILTKAISETAISLEDSENVAIAALNGLRAAGYAVVKQEAPEAQQ